MWATFETKAQKQHYMKFVCKFLCRLRSIATHRDHFVRRLSVCPSVCLSVCPSVTPPELCFAGDTCIPRNAATIFLRFSDSTKPSQSVSLIYELVWLTGIRKSEENWLKTSYKVAPLTEVANIF